MTLLLYFGDTSLRHGLERLIKIQFFNKKIFFLHVFEMF
jgi:hypothetical protein